MWQSSRHPHGSGGYPSKSANAGQHEPGNGYSLPDNYYHLSEVIAPCPAENPLEAPIYRHDSLEDNIKLEHHQNHHPEFAASSTSICHGSSLTTTNCSDMQAIIPHQRRRPSQTGPIRGRSHNTPQEWDTPLGHQGPVSDGIRGDGMSHPHALEPTEQQIEGEEERNGTQASSGPDQSRKGSLHKFCHWIHRHISCLG